MGQVEAILIKNIKVSSLAKILKYLIKCFRVILIVVINSSPKFLAKFKATTKVVKSKVAIIALYNPKANGIVEASYYIITTILLKLGDRISKWFYYLNAMSEAAGSAHTTNHTHIYIA